MSTVMVTMEDGTTREVEDHTIVDMAPGYTTNALVADVHKGRISTVYEPVREDWIKYEPWMRDLLAEDARTSSKWGDYEARRPWWKVAPYPNRSLKEDDLRVHPDDAPEKPDASEELAEVLSAAEDLECGAPAGGVRNRHRHMARAALDHLGIDK